jgi:hypothetical protein
MSLDISTVSATDGSSRISFVIKAAAAILRKERKKGKQSGRTKKKQIHLPERLGHTLPVPVPAVALKSLGASTPKALSHHARSRRQG